jgi:hypothetical protein
VDAALTFDWGTKSPGRRVPADGFSARWVGEILVARDGEYEFEADTDDRVLLRVAGKTVLDARGPSSRKRRGRAELAAGWLPIEVLFHHGRGPARLHVWWSGPGLSRQIVSARRTRTVPHGSILTEAAPRKAAEAPRTQKKPASGGGPNLVSNGGFEKVDSLSRFATGWRRWQWGTIGSSYSARIDRTNPHTGDRALVVRGLDPDALPGASTRVAIRRGTAIVSFWACADVGQKAVVTGSLAGVRLKPRSIGEKWKRITHVVGVAEDADRAELRLWTTSTKVRVWLDDVEVRASR